MRVMRDVVLVSWLYRRTATVSLPAAALAAGYVLLVPGRLRWDLEPRHAWFIWLFVVVHAIALVIVQGRPFSRSTGFLYTRGFGRDRLWLGQMAASAASVLTVVLAAGVVTWTPLRAWWQSSVAESPFYLLHAPGYGAARFEWTFVFRPLWVYTLLLPVLHYAWIRRAAPTRGRLIGPLIVGWFVFAIVLGLLMEDATRSYAGPGVAAAALLVWSWRLHRRMEVGP